MRILLRRMARKRCSLVLIPTVQIRCSNQTVTVNTVIPPGNSFFYDLCTKEEEAIAEENKGLDKALIVEPGIERLFTFEPDVVNTQRKYHFSLVPKFGSVLAFKLIVSNYQNADSFSDHVAKTKQYLADCRDLEEQKAADEKAFAAKMEEAQRTNESTSELIEAYREKSYPPVERPKPVCEQRVYMLIFDNIGEDSPISQECLVELLQLCSLIRQTWEAKNLAKLTADVDLYLDSINKGLPTKVADFDKEYEAFLDSQRRTVEIAEKEEAANGKSNGAVNLATQASLQETCAFLIAKLTEASDELQALSKCNWIRFAEIMQMYLFLHGFTKEDTNVPKTNIISWQRCSQHLNLVLPEHLSDYKFDEEKTGTFKPYQLTNVLLDRMNALSWSDIAAFSYPLYLLGTYLLNLLKLRIENVKVRRQEFTFKKEFRQKRIEQSKERADRRREETEIEKAKFFVAESETPEPQEGAEEAEEPKQPVFNQDEWLREWDEKNPQIEIPEEPTLDQDNDIGKDYVLA